MVDLCAEVRLYKAWSTPCAKVQCIFGLYRVTSGGRLRLVHDEVACEVPGDGFPEAGGLLVRSVFAGLDASLVKSPFDLGGGGSNAASKDGGDLRLVMRLVRVYADDARLPHAVGHCRFDAQQLGQGQLGRGGGIKTRLELWVGSDGESPDLAHLPDILRDPAASRWSRVDVEAQPRVTLTARHDAGVIPTWDPSHSGTRRQSVAEVVTISSSSAVASGVAGDGRGPGRPHARVAVSLSNIVPDAKVSRASAAGCSIELVAHLERMTPAAEEGGRPTAVMIKEPFLSSAAGTVCVLSVFVSVVGCWLLVVVVGCVICGACICMHMCVNVGVDV